MSPTPPTSVRMCLLAPSGPFGIRWPDWRAILGQVTGALTQLFDVDLSQQRLDSVYLFSNMAHLGRIRLFVRTIRKFLVNLKRQQTDLYQALEEDLVRRYEAKKDGWFAVKPSESTRTLEQVGNDCFRLMEHFRNQKAVADMSSYKLLMRLLYEQCVVERNKTGAQVVVKRSKRGKSRPEDGALPRLLLRTIQPGFDNLRFCKRIDRKLQLISFKQKFSLCQEILI